MLGFCSLVTCLYMSNMVFLKCLRLLRPGEVIIVSAVFIFMLTKLLSYSNTLLLSLLLLLLSLLLLLLLILLTTLRTTCMTKTIDVIELNTEFMAVPSSLVQPGKPEETRPVSSKNDMFKISTRELNQFLSRYILLYEIPILLHLPM